MTSSGCRVLHVKARVKAILCSQQTQSLTSGKVVEHTFPSGATLNEGQGGKGVSVPVSDEFGFNFMNNETRAGEHTRRHDRW